MDNTQNIIELCAGYGGISMGIKRVIPGIRVRAYCEIEAYVVANLVEKIEAGKMDTAPIWTDIKTFPGKEFYGKIHGIIGGYPCQPFSTAGQRRGEQDPRHLFPDILRIVQAVKPLWCFFENVEGHLSLGYGEVYRSLRDLGYAVEAGLFSASECGAPHRRKRLFILAVSQNSGQRRGIYRDGADPHWLQEQEESFESDARCETKGCSGASRWPARPGGEQYEWEASRVISNSNSAELSQHWFNDGVGREELDKGNSRSSQIETKPRLGRAVNGTANRLDRIRMLGNGVVPDTAELAFRTLIKKVRRTNV